MMELFRIDTGATRASRQQSYRNKFQLNYATLFYGKNRDFCHDQKSYMARLVFKILL